MPQAINTVNLLNDSFVVRLVQLHAAARICWQSVVQWTTLCMMWYRYADVAITLGTLALDWLVTCYVLLLSHVTFAISSCEIAVNTAEHRATSLTYNNYPT